MCLYGAGIRWDKDLKGNRCGHVPVTRYSRKHVLVNQGPIYRVVQRFRQWWVWLLVLIAPAVCLWAAIQQLILGDPWGKIRHRTPCC